MAKKKSRNIESQITQDSVASRSGIRIPHLAVGTRVALSQGIVTYISPTFALVIAGSELVLAVLVLFAAMFGSETISERAFRLMRMVLNRPEPPTH
ncbi:hypothetical protein [Streptomyces sp. XY006]|uniref:hypothetical protein n=1 Tax=Streptomyces sp. XY006 TaxID=2021410 RepID=UPI000B8BC9A3|nr:hypothetical protein [Streptomyces sp. XY006]OXS33077.1 hypothetical protein CHR28_22475 [Streptomyces sp. XY006]